MYIYVCLFINLHVYTHTNRKQTVIIVSCKTGPFSVCTLCNCLFELRAVPLCLLNTPGSVESRTHFPETSRETGC